MPNSKLLYFLLTALTLAVVVLSIGMSWTLKIVKDMSKQTITSISGPAIDPNLAPSQENVTADKKEASASAFVKIMTSGEAQICTWSNSSSKNQTPIKVSMQNAGNSFLLTMTENNQAQKKYFALRKGLNIYFWQENQDYGQKLETKPILEGTWPKSEQTAIQMFSDVASTLSEEPECLAWQGTESSISFPAKISFSDEVVGNAVSPTFSPSPSTSPSSVVTQTDQTGP